MTTLQLKMLDMISYFHDFCYKHNIRYYVVGGTALGAARHNGFIPWDDDVDVGVPRSDYERLKKLTQNQTFGNYIFEYPSNDKTFVYPYGKLYDSSTTLIESTRYKTKRGIFIDIFPLDGIGNTYEESVSNYKTIDRKVKILSTKICAWRKGRKFYKNICMILMRHLPWNNEKKLRAQISQMSQVHSFEDCLYVANCVGNWHEKEIIKREWLGKPTLIQFEGIQVYCPEKTDEYLSAVYGNWRQLPPKEKQISHHDYIYLDLNTPYTQKGNTYKGE